MPELPEVEALTHDLAARLDGRVIAAVHLAAFSALKTFDPPLSAVEGTFVEIVTRHGKFIDLSTAGIHLIVHLARAGRIRLRDEAPATPPRPGRRSQLTVRIGLEYHETVHPHAPHTTAAGLTKTPPL